MSGLVGYTSSDEEDDIQPERPAKVARVEATISLESESSSIAQEKLPQPVEQLERPSGPSAGPVPGPSKGPLPQNPPTDASPEPSGSATSLSPYTFERQRLHELTMPTVPNFNIPESPPPPDQNSEDAAQLAATTRKFERFLELKKQGIHFNDRLQKSSSLRNPSLLPKLMAFAGIEPEESYASTLPPELAVPGHWPEECYVENLVRWNEKREKRKLVEREKVDFVPAKIRVASVDRTDVIEGSYPVR